MTTHAIADPFFLSPHDEEPDPRLTRWRMRFFVLVLLGVAAWAVVTFLIGPPVIRSGYENTSPIGAINRAFDHRDEHPLDFYLRKWTRVALVGLVAWVGFGLLVLGTTSRAFARRAVGTTTPGALGAIRVLTCLVLAYAALAEPIDSVVKLSPTDRTSMGMMDFVYAEGASARGLPIGFDHLVRSESGLAVYKALTVALLVVGAIGWKTRPVLILAAICYLPLMGIVRSYSWLSHSGVVPFYMLLVLIFTRAGDGWSLDRLIKLWKDQPVPAGDVPSAYYGWARYAIWLVFALPYVAAGLCKLTNDSWRWWEGINLQTILFTDALRPGKSGQDFILQHAWLPTWAFTVMGVMTVVIEVGFGLVLISRVARMIWPIMAIGMHVGIQVLQSILFWDLIVLQVMFYDWTKARHRIGRWLYAKRGSIDVLYDGRCSICRRSVRLLRSWDLFDRLNYLDFRTLDIAAYNAHRGVTLDEGELDKAMHVVWRGRVTSGFEGCRTIASALPVFWVIVPLLYLPGLSHLGAIGYRWLARNRMAFHTCDPNGACALPGHEALIAMPQTSTSSVEARSAAELRDLPLRRKLLGPLVVISVTCFMLGAWAVRLEWYPFTSMQMFSTHSNTGIVTYYRALMTDVWGFTYEARLEKMGRGVSRYRPILSGGFYDAAGRRKCIDMLEFCGRTHNDSNPPNPVAKLEVEKRRWDFVHDRQDPAFGKVVERIAVTFDGVKRGSESGG
ncbi:MAG: DCC1-like thiol-disulfide oxidoreductase family protein [Tepidisphaeraceae bacterium]